MFGDDIFAGQSQSVTNAGLDGSQPSERKGIAEMYEELPNNLAGDLVRVLILLVLLYVLYEVATMLLL